MNTVIYLPMPEWQALAFLRDRDEAFRRLLLPAGNHLPCEVVMLDEVLHGFKNRADAVEIGKRVYPHGFAMVRIVVLGKVLNGWLGLQRHLLNVADPGTGIALYRITRDGLSTLSQKTGGGEVEILVDEIFGSGDHEHTVDRCLTKGDVPDHGLLEDGGRPGMCGPTGFGC